MRVPRPLGQSNVSNPSIEEAPLSTGCWARTWSASQSLIFYEARADAIIAPLPIDRPDLFAPFEYGDFLWQRMTSFIEFRGMERERPGKRIR